MIALAFIIPPLLLGILFMLADDKREYISFIKTDWRIILLTLIPVIIFFGYPILATSGHYANYLWNPYQFGGMPSYASPAPGGLYKWWNLICVGVDTVKRVFFYFPVGGFALIGLVWWNWKRFSAVAYFLLLGVELITLIITFQVSL